MDPIDTAVQKEVNRNDNVSSQSKAKRKSSKTKTKAKRKPAKPKSKKKPAKAKTKKKAAKKTKAKSAGVVRTERLDMRLSKAEKTRITVKANKLRRTVTSLVIEAIEKIK